MGNCCGPSAEQKAANAAEDEAQRKEARAKAAAAAEQRASANATKGAPNAGKPKQCVSQNRHSSPSLALPGVAPPGASRAATVLCFLQSDDPSLD